MLVYLAKVLHHLATPLRVFLCLVFNSLVSLSLHFEYGLCILEVSMCWGKAPGNFISEHPWLPSLCFQEWSLSSFPLHCQYLLLSSANVRIYLHIAIFLVASLKHREISYILSCVAVALWSSIGMKVVTAHGARGILKDIFKSIHSLHLRCTWSFFLCLFWSKMNFLLFWSSSNYNGNTNVQVKSCLTNLFKLSALLVKWLKVTCKWTVLLQRKRYKAHIGYLILWAQRPGTHWNGGEHLKPLFLSMTR